MTKEDILSDNRLVLKNATMLGSCKFKSPTLERRARSSILTVVHMEMPQVAIEIFPQTTVFVTPDKSTTLEAASITS